MSHPPAPSPLQLVVVLAAAVLGVSSSAVIIRGMDAGPAAIAAWRCLLAAILLAPGWPAARHLSPGDRRWIVVSGIFLGLHFGTWFASLSLTTVLRSTVFVALVPVWTAVFEWWLHGRRPSVGFSIGVGIALLGVAGLATGEGAAGWRGDLLAIGAGALWAVHLLVGREVRQRVPTTTYMGLVSATAAVVMAPVALALGETLIGFSSQTWGLLLLATLGPQLIGHQGFSYAVKHLPASTIAAVMLLEPVGATLLAGLFLEEWPTPTALLAGSVVVCGVAVALRSRP